MSTPNPFLAAAAPELIAILQAIKQFNTNIGPDPQQWALKVPGALTVLLGTVQLQLPAVLLAEGGAVQTEVNSKIDSWVASIQKSTTTASTPAA